MFAALTGLLGILIGTATDIKKREVPDWVNYGMIAAGFGLAVMAALSQWSWHPLLFSLAGFGLGMLVGSTMYYTGQWGGGDAKMVMGLGALLGVPVIPYTQMNSSFLVIFLVLSLFVGAAYGIMWMFGLFLGDRKKARAEIESLYHSPFWKHLRIIFIVVVIIGLLISFILAAQINAALGILFATIPVISYLTFHLLLLTKAVEKGFFIQQRAVKDLVPGDWVYHRVLSQTRKVFDKKKVVTEKDMELIEQGKQPGKYKCWALVYAVPLLKLPLRVSALSLQKNDRLLSVLELENITIPRGTKLTEKQIDNINTELRQGMYSDVHIKRKTPLGSITTLVSGEYLKEGDELLDPLYKGNALAGLFATGLQTAELEALKKAKIEKVIIKEGIPFVPSFLIAYLLTFWWLANDLPVLFWL